VAAYSVCYLVLIGAHLKNILVEMWNGDVSLRTGGMQIFKYLIKNLFMLRS
jgi:hypothetical protein